METTRKTPDTWRRRGKLPNTWRRRGKLPNTWRRRGKLPNTWRRRGKLPNTWRRRGKLPNTWRRRGKLPNTWRRRGKLPNTWRRRACSTAAKFAAPAVFRSPCFKLYLAQHFFSGPLQTGTAGQQASQACAVSFLCWPQLDSRLHRPVLCPFHAGHSWTAGFTGLCCVLFMLATAGQQASQACAVSFLCWPQLDSRLHRPVLCPFHAGHSWTAGFTGLCCFLFMLATAGQQASQACAVSFLCWPQLDSRLHRPVLFPFYAGHSWTAGFTGLCCFLFMLATAGQQASQDCAASSLCC